MALEGGYSLAATSVSAAACMEALLGLTTSSNATTGAGALAPVDSFDIKSPAPKSVKKKLPPARFRKFISEFE